MVMLPLVLFILALSFKVKPAKALHSSLMVSIGFVGIYAIFDTLASNVGPTAQAMVERTGISLPVVGLGWSPFFAITWGLPIAPPVVPLIILINAAMLALNKTRTVDVDMWNYWHFALAGTLVYYSIGNLFFGLLATAAIAVVVLKLTDRSAPLVQKHFGLEGTFLPTLSSMVFFPVGLLVDRIIDHVPGLNHIHIGPETVQKKFGISGRPIMTGTILGTLLGVITGYDFKKVLLLGISIGGVMFILPRMVHILMEGLLPLPEVIKKYLSAKYSDHDGLHIGLDVVTTIGNPAIISTALLLTPILVFIALILPDNEVLLFGGLTSLAVMVSMIALVSRGNIFHTVLTATPAVIAGPWIAIKIAPFIAGTTKDVSFKFAEDSSGQVSNFLDDGSLFHFWLLEIFSGNIITTGLVPVIVLVLHGIFRVTRSTVYA